MFLPLIYQKLVYPFVLVKKNFKWYCYW